jgi:hypothetical protein
VGYVFEPAGSGKGIDLMHGRCADPQFEVFLKNSFLPQRVVLVA